LRKDPSTKDLSSNVKENELNLERTSYNLTIASKGDACEKSKRVYFLVYNIDTERCIQNSRFLNCFDSLELLGKGGSAEVYKVRHTIDKKIYAVKGIRVKHNTKKEKVYREIKAMKN
jgi:serine/threonine protein kinase